MILILEYFYWQFIEIPKRIGNVFLNLIWLGYKFFSIDYCFKTLFSPWRKIIWSYKKGFDLGNRMEILFSNTFSRFIGFLMRVFIITFFIIYEFLIFLAWIILTLIWTLLPIIAVLGICLSYSLFQNV